MSGRRTPPEHRCQPGASRCRVLIRPSTVRWLKQLPGRCSTAFVAGKATLEDPRLLEAASDADHVVAGPLLLAFGIVTGAERQELLARLDRRGLSDRAELIRIAAAAANTLPPLGASHRHRLLSRLAAGETLDDLDAAEREELCAWSRSL